MKYANIINGIYTEYASVEKLPKFFESRPHILNYQKAGSVIHNEDGFKEKIVPPITEFQYLGKPYLDTESDKYTNHVIDFTQEEIDQKNKESIRSNRDRLLKDGFVVEYDGFEIWFNEENLNSFLNNIFLASNLSETDITWKDTSGGWQVILLNDAIQISKLGRGMLQTIYLEN